MRYKEVLIGAVVAIVLIFGFIFRTRIFHPTLPLSQDQVGGEPSDQQTPLPLATSSPDNTAGEQGRSATSSASKQVGVVYSGRPADEVRFLSEDGLTQEQKDKVSAEIKKYAKIVKESPEYGTAWLQLAILKKGIGDYEGARGIWEYLVLARPHEATAFLNLGDLYTNYVKDYPRAERAFRGAITADPKNTMGYTGLADLYTFFYKEKKAQAEVVLKEGLAANPGDANLQKALARLYEREAQ